MAISKSEYLKGLGKAKAYTDSKFAEVESETDNKYQEKGDYLTEIPDEYVTETELDNKGYLTEHQDLSDYATKEELDEIKLFKFPNATIIGSPIIESGQVSGFSKNDYLMFPFIVDVRNYAFEIVFCFTTSDNIITQQNILDSEYGLAIAIQDGHGIIALGSNGSSFDIGTSNGTYSIKPNTTYYAKITWDKTSYKTYLSTDGNNYILDMTIDSAKGLYPKTIYIGGSKDLFGTNSAHPFYGTINMNKAYLIINGQQIWSGMDDAGLATRADISLNNIDSKGIAKISEIAGASETDPTVPSHVKSITQADIDIWNSKANAGDYLTPNDSIKVTTVDISEYEDGANVNIFELFNQQHILPNGFYRFEDIADSEKMINLYASEVYVEGSWCWIQSGDMLILSEYNVSDLLIRKMNGLQTFRIDYNLYSYKIITNPLRQELPWDNLTEEMEDNINGYALTFSNKGMVGARWTDLSEIYAKKEAIPTTLPNPNPLTINGQTYDGSQSVSIEVEGCGSGDSFITEFTMDYDDLNKLLNLEIGVYYATEGFTVLVEDRYVNIQGIFTVDRGMIGDEFNIINNGYILEGGSIKNKHGVENVCFELLREPIPIEYVLQTPVDLETFKPTFGNEGQVLKTLGNDYGDTEWIDLPTALPNPNPLIINGQTYDGTEEINVTVEGSGESIQSDWEETDIDSPSYINNKPFNSLDEMVEHVFMEVSTAFYQMGLLQYDEDGNPSDYNNINDIIDAKLGVIENGSY